MVSAKKAALVVLVSGVSLVSGGIESIIAAESTRNIEVVKTRKFDLHQEIGTELYEDGIKAVYGGDIEKAKMYLNLGLNQFKDAAPNTENGTFLLNYYVKDAGKLLTLDLEGMRQEICRRNILQLNGALMLYQNEHGKYPENLKVLIDKKMPYINPTVPRIFHCPSDSSDLLNTSYVYITPTEKGGALISCSHHPNTF